MDEIEDDNYHIEEQEHPAPISNKSYSSLSSQQQLQIEETQVIDGILFQSENLGFFRLDPPFDVSCIRIQAKADERFKGLENWRETFPHLLELRIGKIHNHTLSILFAYEGHRVISFAKLINGVKHAFRYRILQLPDDCLVKREMQNSVSEKICFRSREDFDEISAVIKSDIDNRLRNIRCPSKSCFVLYKFGQSTDREAFVMEFPWVCTSRLSGLIIHYAKDIRLKQHILWFKAKQVAELLDTPPAVYFVGIQPGLGNVRHVVSQRSLHDTYVTHITFYTRIFQEIHRDPFGYFTTKRRLHTSLLEECCEVFNTGKEKWSDVNKANSMLRDRVPIVVLNSANLAHEYPARVEAVVKINLLSRHHRSLPDLVTNAVEQIDAWMARRGYYSLDLLFGQETRLFATQIKPWFEYFAGTITFVSKLVDKLKMCKPDLANGKIVSTSLNLHEEIAAVYAVDCLLTLCYTGCFVCNVKWRKPLGIDAKLFSKDLSYSWKFPNLLKRERDGALYVRLGTSAREFGRFFSSMFYAQVPAYYNDVLTKSTFVENSLQPRTAFKLLYRKEHQTASRNLAESIVNLFVQICLQYSGISNLQKTSLFGIIQDINPRELRNVQVVTVSEFVHLLQGICVKEQQYLDHRFWLFRNVICKLIQTKRHSNYWIFLTQAFQNRIIDSEVPIVCKASASTLPPTLDLVIVPDFEELQETRITRYNSAWIFAAYISRKQQLPDNSTSKVECYVYECLLSMNTKERKAFAVGSFIKFVAASVFRDSNYVAEISKLPPNSRQYLIQETIGENDNVCQRSEANVVEYALEKTSKTLVPHSKRSKLGRFAKPKKLKVKQGYFGLCNSELLQKLRDFKQSLSRPKPNLDLTADSQICSFLTLYPVTLFEVSCNYGGNEFMEATFIVSAIEHIRSISRCPDDTMVTNFNFLMYSRCLGSAEPTWSEDRSSLALFTTRIKMILHALLLDNHYVLLRCQILRSQESIRIKIYTHNSLKSGGQYDKKITHGALRFSELVKEQIQITSPQKLRTQNVCVEITESFTLQQKDGRNCGAACVRTAELVLRQGCLESNILKMNMDDYKWRITEMLLKSGENGNKLCDFFCSDRQKVEAFLKTVYDENKQTHK